MFRFTDSTLTHPGDLRSRRGSKQLDPNAISPTKERRPSSEMIRTLLGTKRRRPSAATHPADERVRPGPVPAPDGAAEKPASSGSSADGKRDLSGSGTAVRHGARPSHQRRLRGAVLVCGGIGAVLLLATAILRLAAGAAPGALPRCSPPEIPHVTPFLGGASSAVDFTRGLLRESGTDGVTAGGGSGWVTFGLCYRWLTLGFTMERQEDATYGPSKVRRTRKREGESAPCCRRC